MWRFIPPENQNYFSQQMFEDLENDIVQYRSKGCIILLRDFNCCTGKGNDDTSSSIRNNHFLTSNDPKNVLYHQFVRLAIKC